MFIWQCLKNLTRQGWYLYSYSTSHNSDNSKTIWFHICIIPCQVKTMKYWFQPSLLGFQWNFKLLSLFPYVIQYVSISIIEHQKWMYATCHMCMRNAFLIITILKSSKFLVHFTLHDDRFTYSTFVFLFEKAVTLKIEIHIFNYLQFISVLIHWFQLCMLYSKFGGGTVIKLRATASFLLCMLMNLQCSSITPF